MTTTTGKPCRGIRGASSTGGYPATAAGRQSLTLHQFLLGPALSGLEWDHKDRDPLNNRRENLQAVPHHVNMKNKRAYHNNTSGVPGVCLAQQRYWLARIGDRHLGCFDSFEEAVAARRAAERELWKDECKNS